MPQEYDPSFWAVLTGIPLLALFVAALYARRRSRERVGLAGPPATAQVPSSTPDAAETESAPRRRPINSPPSPSEHDLASAVRSTILRMVSERAPAGWTTLVLCPPAHPSLMTWHVHLAAEVALDLPDGRSVAVGAPASSHEWQLPNGRTVGVGNGDPVPAPSNDTLAVRVAGPYLQVTVRIEDAEPPVLVARVEGGPDGSPEMRVSPQDTAAMAAALREAIELAIGTRMLGSPPTLGYRRAAWAGHDRVWLTVGR